MKTSPSTPPAPVVHIDLQLFDTARRRAERLREQAIDDAVHGAARAPRRLLHLLRTALRRARAQLAAGGNISSNSKAEETAACRS